MRHCAQDNTQGIALKFSTPSPDRRDAGLEGDPTRARVAAPARIGGVTNRARAVEPENSMLALRIEAAEASRARGEPTVPSTLALELATNPFVRCETPQLQTSLRQQNRLESDHPTAVFATVRGWKDSF